LKNLFFFSISRKGGPISGLIGPDSGLFFLCVVWPKKRREYKRKTFAIFFSQTYTAKIRPLKGHYF
jgi:hypothetical protein